MRSCLVLVPCFLIAACASPPSTDGALSAAEGGTVTAAGLTLVVPPGALAEDTSITVDVLDTAGLPDAADIVSSVYDLGPDGLTFLSPVSLTLTATVPDDGRTPTVAWLQDGAWTPVASTVSGDDVVAAVDHFTVFAVVLTGDAQVDGGCDTFAACGGDPTGSWTYTAGCLTLHNPPSLPCSSATFVLTIDVGGSLDLGGDGTFSIAQTTRTTSTLTVPRACVGAPDCTFLGDDAVASGDNCVSTDVSDDTDDVAGTWTSAGSALTLTAGGQDGVMDFCVQGDTLMLQALGQDADAQYTATRAR